MANPQFLGVADTCRDVRSGEMGVEYPQPNPHEGHTEEHAGCHKERQENPHRAVSTTDEAEVRLCAAQDTGASIPRYLYHNLPSPPPQLPRLLTLPR